MKKKKKWNTNEEDQFRSIKVPLKSIVRNPDTQKFLGDTASEINKLVVLGYQLVRLFLVFKHRENKLPEVNEQLYETALSVILNPDKKPRKSCKSINKIKEELSVFYKTHFMPLICTENLPKISNISTTIQKLRVEMYTSFINNIVIHYYDRLSKALGVILEANDKYKELKTNDERKKVHSKLLRDLLNKTVSLPEFTDSLQLARSYMPDLGDKSLAINLLSKPKNFIKYTFTIADLLEKNGLKMFQSIPLRKSEIPKHFPINSITLVNLADCCKILGTRRLKNNTELSTRIGKEEGLKWVLWNHFFKLDKKIFNQKGYEFCHSIDTDGFSCTIKFMKENHTYKKYKKKKRRLVWSPQVISELPKEIRDEIISKCKIIGGDPGKGILLQLIDDTGVSLRYTIGQRYSESKFYKYRKIRHSLKTRDKIDQKENLLSEYRSKSMNLEKFKAYIQVKAKVSLEIIKHYNKIIYRKLGFRSQILSKNSTNKFIDNIEKTYGENAVIAYGNWSRSTQMRGIAPTPGIGLKRQCAHRFRLFDLDEFGTSKYCHRCHKEVKNFYYKGEKIHRVLVCKECSGPQGVSRVRFIHRDINGSANIQKLGLYEFQGVPRPSVFCRKSNNVLYQGAKTKDLNLAKKVPKIIKKKAPGSKAVLTKEMV